LNNDLTLKLVKRFPVIYQDFYSPMSVTCMCWGFDHGNGWNDIIWQLSLAIENELQYSWLQERWFLFAKAFSIRWNKLIYKLSPVRQRQYKMEGKGTKEEPYYQVLVHYDCPPWDEEIAQFLFGKIKKIGKFEIERMGLKNFVLHPYTGFAVSQVKEKFGTLRYYCPINGRIDAFISLAECLSENTCEECGAAGKLGESAGWYSTKCKKCAPKNHSAY
jgi:hypothetical protein